MSIQSFVTALLLAGPLAAAIPNSCRPAKSFEQGHELRQHQLAAAYNASARITVRGSLDVYTFGNFLYWQPLEDNLELGIFSEDAVNNLPITGGKVIAMHTNFTPGVQAGFGINFDHDNWDGLARYTWFFSDYIKKTDSLLGEGTLIPTTGHPANLARLIATSVTSGKERWKLWLEAVDAVFGRSCYVGTKLTFRPFFGGRATWISQLHNVFYTPDGDSPFESSQKTVSWGLGPQIGLDINWLIGAGFRLIGSAESDLLFTSYKCRIHEQRSTNPSIEDLSISERKNILLRPHADLEMGFGWGSYFANHNYHLDFYATYGFQVFWDQNMFRQFYSATSAASSGLSNGNLYLQGATGGIRLDF